MLDASAEGPSYPRPTDIWFDHAGARAAIDAIAELRLALIVAWAAELDAGEAALAQWCGAAATSFGHSLRARGVRTEQLVVELARLEGAIDAARDDAIRSQAHIDALQAEWDAAAARATSASRAR